MCLDSKIRHVFFAVFLPHGQWRLHEGWRESKATYLSFLVFLFGPSTSELKRIWQTLQEMTGRLVLINGTPKVWLMTAFCTGSI